MQVQTIGDGGQSLVCLRKRDGDMATMAGSSDQRSLWDLGKESGFLF